MKNKNERQPDRLPPNQQLAAPGKWPVVGEKAPAETNQPWSLTIEGHVSQSLTWTLDQLLALPMQELTTDLHCVTRWSQYDLQFQGIPLLSLLDQASPKAPGKFAIFHARSDRNHTTSLPLGDLTELKPWIVFYHNQQPIESRHGGPIRLLVEGRYLYKSLKWLERIEITEEDQLGYWEGEAGYHNHGDPWKEERYFLPGLNHAQLQQAMQSRDLSNGMFSGLHAEGMNLSQLNAEKAILRNANFDRCQLAEANFSQSNLSNAKLRGADLRNVNFTGADLEGVDFRGADLRGADFTNASLIAATFTSQSGMEEAGEWGPARIDSFTKLPPKAALEEQLTPEQSNFVRCKF